MTSSLDMIRGRSNVVTLTNKSGGPLVAGDVCVIDTANDEAATTTTSAASVLKVYIAAESIADNATGKFYSAGFCPLVTPSASTTRGRYLFTHTVAKQAAESATYGAGAFGVILKSGTTPSVWLFGSTAQGSGGGAPTTTPYVTTAADGGLSAEVVIPGLAGSADIAGAAGAGTSHEFESGDTAPTWTPSDPTFDVGTTIKSHLYITYPADTTTRNGLYAWSPAGDFDARACVDCAQTAYTTTPDIEIGLVVANSDLSVMAFARVLNHLFGGYVKRVQAWTFASSTYTQRGSDLTLYLPKYYFRITRVSGTFNFYWSGNGHVWQLIASQALTMTVAKIGIRILGDTAITGGYGIVDWLRTNV